MGAWVLWTGYLVVLLVGFDGSIWCLRCCFAGLRELVLGLHWLMCFELVAVGLWVFAWCFCGLRFGDFLV